MIRLPLAGVLSVLTSPFRAAAGVGLSAISSWVVAGAQALLHEVVAVIGLISTPSLSASWFSPEYWRIAGLATLLTLPFLFAAAVQAIVRGDLGVLLRAGFVDLPIAALGVTLAAPVIGLLLAATDEMCSLVTGPSLTPTGLLSHTATQLGSLSTGFLPVVIAVVILFAGLVLLVELVLRAAAIYIVVLFLPLGFAAMVWPARRIWVRRMGELLIALILSKFAMVAILSLAVSGFAAVSSGGSPLTDALTSMALITLAAGAPWALLRLLPFTELAAEHGPLLHREARGVVDSLPRPLGSGYPDPDASGGRADALSASTPETAAMLAISSIAPPAGRRAVGPGDSGGSGRRGEAPPAAGGDGRAAGGSPPEGGRGPAPGGNGVSSSPPIAVPGSAAAEALAGARADMPLLDEHQAETQINLSGEGPWLLEAAAPPDPGPGGTPSLPTPEAEPDASGRDGDD